jgi:hypothetical protein
MKYLYLPWESTIRFVDIGAMADHHCVNFHLIIIYEMTTLREKHICDIHVYNCIAKRYYYSSYINYHK